MKTLKKIGKWFGIVVLVIIAVGTTLYFVYLKPVLKKIMTEEVVPYDKELTIILGGGGNTGILVSDSLVVVIDSKMDDPAKELAKRVKEMAGQKPILVVNTHYHPDHCGGNNYYEGHTVIAGNYGHEAWEKEASKKTLPTRWLTDKMVVPMGSDTAVIFSLQRNAHTQNDVFVYLHQRKMLFGGDVILNQQVPSLMSPGADPEGYLSDFDALQKQLDIQKIVPGHGPVGGIEILENFRQYFLDMKTAASDEGERDELVSKYKDWTQVPMLMSPSATINLFKKKK